MTDYVKLGEFKKGAYEIVEVRGEGLITRIISSDNGSTFHHKTREDGTHVSSTLHDEKGGTYNMLPLPTIPMQKQKEGKGLSKIL